MKLPRKLKKKLKKEFGSEIVDMIIKGKILYKSNNQSILTENGWKIITQKKNIFCIID